MSVTEALTEALSGLTIRPTDKAAVALATEYAARIDADGDLSRLGPALLACLESLGMTPKGRAAIAGKGAQDSGPTSSPLDEVRKRREARKNGTPAVDSPAP